jgi:carbamoyl-phosphate synthase large subunit
MPKRTDLKKILVLGSGGIVIGQACEFDYSGTQAIQALKQEGYQVVLVNSNPATIMTDPELADRTYIEPLTVPILEKVIEKERPCAILPTVGGQTALNLAIDLAKAGVLEKYGVELLGADIEAIDLAEDRHRFRAAMLEAGLDVPASTTVETVEAAVAYANEIGYPLIIRPSFTLGGSGGGFAANEDELRKVAGNGLLQSPVNQVLVEQSIAGWKEYELEVVRDKADNFIVVCSIENVDPMGVHTGDSITVAPAQTLTDPEYQKMRDWARQIVRIVGVETGGANVQFGVNPVDGRLIVVEMNPRVSRSSALASKATGFPIAKVATRLAIGYTLDELPNEITGTTPCSFEPALDYVVVKIPRWDFAKFPGADDTLGPQMKSVGEVMAIGRSFREALQKGFRSLEVGLDGFEPIAGRLTPNPMRLLAVAKALEDGQTVAELYEKTGIDPWFLDQFLQLMEARKSFANHAWTADTLRKAKRNGFSSSALARLSGCSEAELLKHLENWKIFPAYQRVDTCAAEFAARTNYLYSSYQGTVDEAEPSDREKVIILGSGPNRIGQGIEFDYCCVHASMALRQAGIESIMINCNPETVSTDYDTSDRLYFEPLTFEDVYNVIRVEQQRGKLLGVLVQLGGQTPLKLTQRLAAAGVTILGTSPDTIEAAEDRDRFRKVLDKLELNQPMSGMASSFKEAEQLASHIGYPLLVRPSYVLGGRAMAIASSPSDLPAIVQEALSVSEGRPLLLDQFLEDAVEVDVDCLGDGQRVVIAGVLQHIEEAGVHSGDSACILPPYKVSLYHLTQIREAAHALGQELQIRGLMNIQFAIKGDLVYVLEVNPRASRTVPFLAKATGVPLARLATRLMLGFPLELQDEPTVKGFFVKEALLPFRKFPGADSLLGPEMRSTGEVMGQDLNFGNAFAKSQIGAGCPLPLKGRALFTVNDFDKASMLRVARDLFRLGFKLCATEGTANYFKRAGLEVDSLAKLSENDRSLLDEIRNGKVDVVFNTPLRGQSYGDGRAIRRVVIEQGIPLVTTTSAAQAAVQAIRAMQEKSWAVRAVQDWA